MNTSESNASQKPATKPVTKAARTSRLSLATRLALAWSLGAGLIVGVVGGSSYFFVRRYLIQQSEIESSNQAYVNASVVKNRLRSNVKPGSLLTGLRSESRSFPFVQFDGDVLDMRSWRGIAPLNTNQLPVTLTKHLAQGRAGRQRFTLPDGEVGLAVGVPMPAVDAFYVEVFPLGGLDQILRRIAQIVIAGMVGAIAFGAALGGWTARRLLRPVAQVAEAAEALAAGQLDTRLAEEGDPDLNRVAASFNTMVDAVQRRIEREERFASDVSHELRTPLGVMSAAADVLTRRKPEMPERAAQAVDVITGQLTKVSAMVLDLLEIARIDAGVADIHLESCDVAALTRRIMEGHELPATLMEVEPAAVHAAAHLDPRRYEQIVRNLLDNARKYAGGVTVVRVTADRRFVSVIVEDNGPGVPPAERQRVFERFARGRSTHDVPGTGLGLALASDQAELLKAVLSVDDAPGGGARFTLRMTRA